MSEAERLANEFERAWSDVEPCVQAAAELRRLSAELEDARTEATALRVTEENLRAELEGLKKAQGVPDGVVLQIDAAVTQAQKVISDWNEWYGMHGENAPIPPGGVVKAQEMLSVAKSLLASAPPAPQANEYVPKMIPQVSGYGEQPDTIAVSSTKQASVVQQEPVAWWKPEFENPLVSVGPKQPLLYPDARPLYTHPAPQVSVVQQEPRAWMWQHDESGHVGFVDTWQLENGWKERNPRLQVIAPLYTPPAPQAKPLSDEQRSKLYRAAVLRGDDIVLRSDYEQGIKDAEAAHGIVAEPPTASRSEHADR